MLQQIYIQRNVSKEFFGHQKGSPDGGRERQGGIRGNEKEKVWGNKKIACIKQWKSSLLGLEIYENTKVNRKQTGKCSKLFIFFGTW